MMIEIFRHGWRKFLTYRKLWVSLYLLKAALALVISVPALMVMQVDLDQSLYATPLLGSWSVKVIGELLFQKWAAFSALVMTLLTFTVLVFGIKQYLNGGIYAAYMSNSRLSRSDFYAQCAARTMLHLRISGLMLILYAILLGIGMFVAPIVTSVTKVAGMDSGNAELITWVAVVFLFMIPGVVFSDVIRVTATAGSQMPVRATLKAAFDFYRSHWVQVVGAYVAVYIPFLIVWIIVEKAALLVTGGLGSKLGVLIELLLFQACALLRSGQSLLFTSNVAAIFQSANPGRTSLVSEASSD